MKQSERVKLARSLGFAGYDKTIDSKCSKPEKYGIRRVRSLQDAIDASPRKTPRKEFRKLGHRYTFRTNDDLFERLQLDFTASAFVSMQDHIVDLIEIGLKTKEKGRSKSEATTQNDTNSIDEGGADVNV